MRSYLLTGASTIFWLGCGVWTSALGALAAGWLINPFGPNANVTIFNVGAFLASVCHTGAVVANLGERLDKSTSAAESAGGFGYLAVAWAWPCWFF